MKQVQYKKFMLSALAMAVCTSLSAAETTEEKTSAEKGLDFERIVNRCS